MIEDATGYGVTVTVAAVLIASAIDDAIDGRLAWILVAALGIGYMLSRGLAKSGSRHREGNDTVSTQGEPLSAD